MPRAKIPVTVVTGTFGSGKSTTVRRLVELAASRGEEVAVVSASLNPPPYSGAQLVVAADEEVVERSPGCACCAVRHDLVRVLRNLGERRCRPTRIIVETSAVADIATLEQTLMGEPALRPLVALDGVITTVDAGAWSVRLTVQGPVDRTGDEQLALADIILLTRVEGLSEDGFDAVVRGLRQRNRLGRICIALPGREFPPALLDVGRDDLTRLADRLDQLTLGQIGCSAGGMHTMVLALPGHLDPDMVEDWLEDVMHRHGQGLLRFHAVLALAPGSDGAARVVYRGGSRSPRPRP
jgi:G3E family GTPase